MKITALAGGVGGAKMADGFYHSPMVEELSIIVNVGDDFNHFGLRICPDLDTVCYTLAGIANPETGWGRRDDTYNVLSALKQINAPDWFILGDKDLATHLERTRLLNEGWTLDQVTDWLCEQWHIQCKVIPVTNSFVPTIEETQMNGYMPFQEYFVKHRCEPVVNGFKFIGANEAQPAAGVIEAIETSDLVVLCPSNPWVSIDPILSVSGINTAVRSKFVVAVSPIIAGKTLKGPAAKMFMELGIDPSPVAVADHYGNLLSAIVIDQEDRGWADRLNEIGLYTFVTNTIMRTQSDRRQLAEEIIAFCKDVSKT